jgi:alkylation response protein AidB-like acyl-CoA dehydrogenase
VAQDGPDAIARRIAEEVLFPAASDVEAAGSVPVEHLDLLAAEGLYGLFARAEVAPTTAFRVVENLASGCLSTAFVWLQHHSAVRAIGRSGSPVVRQRWLADLCSGAVRAGAVLGGLRPGPPSLRARPVSGGLRLDGEAPWVTGWGLVSVLYTAARDPADRVVWVLVDAEPSQSLLVEELELLAVRASRTVHLRFVDHFVAAERVVTTMPFAEWPERDAAGLRPNGSLALGVADRCRRLLPDGDRAPVDAARAGLDVAGPAQLPAARAAAAELALRYAAQLVVGAGARGVLAGEDPQRLLREAAFLLVFGSRPGIRAELTRLLSR